MLEKRELQQLRKFCGKMEIDKSMHTLEGILRGIDIDSEINPAEVKDLAAWTSAHQELIVWHPYSEILPVIMSGLEDGILTSDELEDIRWVTRNYTTDREYYDCVTSDLQRLHGIIHGVLADGVMTDQEIIGLKAWLKDHDHLLGTYPFDEIEAVLIGITADGKITEDERQYATAFLSQFSEFAPGDENDLHFSEMRKKMQIGGVCTLNANIEIPGRQFCLTGVFESGKRSEVEEKIGEKGGVYRDVVLKSTDYLVVGKKSNPLWAFACYGRKVEKAMAMRKAGSAISIVTEVDFWDALVE